MTKKEIVRDICDRANKEQIIAKGNLTQLATKEIVQWTFEAIIETLVQEGRIELRNFGVFEVKQRKPRKARNPRTGARVDVEAKNVVTFQPGKTMEEKVRLHAKPVEPKKKKTKKSKPVAVTAPSLDGQASEVHDTMLVKTKPHGNGSAKPEAVGAGASSEAPGTAS